MSAKNNLILVVDGRILDAQEIMRKIKAKYGENPIISEDAKRFKNDYQNQKVTLKSDEINT